MKRAVRLILPVALVLLVALVFRRVAGQDFVLYDDDVHVFKNPHIWPLTAARLLWFWRHPYQNLYIPLSYTFYLLLAAAARLYYTNPQLTDTGALFNPHIFHLFNLLLHLINVLLVYSLLRRITGKEWPSAAGALLFAIHPLQVESVAWIAEMRGLLSNLLCLLSMRLYLASADSGRPAIRRGLYAAALLCQPLAMTAKPSAMVLGPVLLLIETGLLRRPWKLSAARLWPWILTALPFVILTRIVQPPYAPVQVALWKRLFVMCDALTFYLMKFLAPLKLGIDYGRVPAIILRQPFTYVEWVLPVAIALLLWRYKTTHPRAAACGLISLVVLLPVLGLVPFDFQRFSTTADRYTYLAMLGPAALLSLGTAKLRSGAGVRIAATACALWMGALGVLSAAQLPAWDNTGALMLHARAVNPGSYASYQNYAAWLSIHEKYPEALRTYDEALRIFPHDYSLYRDYGLDLAKMNPPDNARAVLYLRQGLAYDPTHPDGYNLLGTTLVKLNRHDEAMEAFRQAIRCKWSYYDSHHNLAYEYSLRRDAPAAIRELSICVSLKPHLAETHDNLGQVLAACGRLPEAIHEFETALQLDAHYAAAIRHLDKAHRYLNGTPSP